MRQEVIYSLMAVAVAPVTVQAQEAKAEYHSLETAQTLTAGTETTLLTSTSVKIARNDLGSFTISFISNVDLGNPDAWGNTVLNDFRNWFGITYVGKDAEGEDLGGALRISRVSRQTEGSVFRYAITLGANSEVEAYPSEEGGAITVKMTPEEAVVLSEMVLMPSDSYVQNLLADFYDEVDEYASYVMANNNGYKPLSADNNAELLLLKDITVPGNLEGTIENFEKFDIYNGLDKIYAAFAELKAKIEGDKIKKEIIGEDNTLTDEAIAKLKEELQEIIDDEETSQDLEDSSQDILDLITGDGGLEEQKQELKDYLDHPENPEFSNEEANKKKDQLVAISDYIAWLLIANDVQAAIDAYQTLLDELKNTYDPDQTDPTYVQEGGKDTELVDKDEEGKWLVNGAGLGSKQHDYFERDIKRLAGEKLALAEFLKAAADAYKEASEGDEPTGKFEEPKDIKGKRLKANSTTDYEETDVFNTISSLLGAKEESGEPRQPKAVDVSDKSVWGNIMFATYCANQYEAETQQLFTDIETATRVYNERQTILEAKFQAIADDVKAKAEEDETYLQEFSANHLPTVRELVYNKVMLGTAANPDATPAVDREPGILLITDEVKAAKKTAGSISQTEEGSFENAPFDKWQNELVGGVLTGFDNERQTGTSPYIDAWITNATKAYDRYTEYHALINKKIEGTGDRALGYSLQGLLDKFIADNGGEKGKAGLEQDVQKKVSDIQSWIDVLNGKLNTALNTLVPEEGEPIMFALNENSEWGTERDSRWNDRTYGDNPGDATANPAVPADEYHSYANILQHIQKLNQLQYNLDMVDGELGLAGRLKKATEALNAMTPETAENETDPTYTDPKYKAENFFGYKNIDDPSTATDEAKDNKGYAKLITDWISKARAEIKANPEMTEEQIKALSFEFDVNPSEEVEDVRNVDYDYIDGMIANLEGEIIPEHQQPSWPRPITIPEEARGGDAFKAIYHYREIYDLIQKDLDRIEEIYEMVKDNGIYADSYKDIIDGWNNQVKGDKTKTGDGKYDGKDAIDFISNLDSNLGTAEAPLKNRGANHWSFLTQLTYTPIDDFPTDQTIQNQLADYATEAFKKQVGDLFTYLYGDNGYDENVDNPETNDVDETGTPGYIDQVITKYNTYKELYKKLFNDKPAGDVFGIPEHSADRGNFATLAAIFADKGENGILDEIMATTGLTIANDNGEITEQTTVAQLNANLVNKTKAFADYLRIKYREDNGTVSPADWWYYLAQENQRKPTQAEWNAVNDELLHVKDVLDVFNTTMEEGENLNDVVASEGTVTENLEGVNPMPTNLDLVYELVYDLAKNKEAYDELIKLKGRLETRVENILAELGDLEPTPEGDDLIKLIEDEYKPVPARETPKIEQFYKDCEAYAQGSTSKKKPDVEEAYENVFGHLTTYNPDQYEWHLLKDSLDRLNTLYDNFMGVFATTIQDNNNSHFQNHIVGAYDKAMTAYNEAVRILKEFATPQDPVLLAAYEDAFEEATLDIYTVPNALRAARALAQEHLDACNSTTDADGKPRTPNTYKPADIYETGTNNLVVEGVEYETDDTFTDKERIQQIEMDMIAALNKFVNTMNEAAIDRWDEVRGEYEGYISAADNTIKNNGDQYKFNKVEVNGELVEYQYHPAEYFNEEQMLINDAQDYSDMSLVLDATNKKLPEGDFEEFLEFDNLLVAEDGLQGIPATVKTKLNQAAYEDVLNRIKEYEKTDVLPIKNKLAEPLKDAEGNEIPFLNDEMLAELGLETYPDGYGPVAADGNRYAYKTLLSQWWDGLQSAFKQTYANHVTAAGELADDYYADEQLPTYTNDFNRVVNSRQRVLDLLEGFGEWRWAEYNGFVVNTALDVAYNDKLRDVKYLTDWNDFGDRLNKVANGFTGEDGKEHVGLLDLYVGPDFADDIEDLKENYLNNFGRQRPGQYGNISFLHEKLDQIIKDAKEAEGEKLLDELLTLKDNYNQMVAAAGKLVDNYTGTDEDELNSLKEARDKLVKKYTINDEIEAGTAEANVPEAEKKLDIDRNVTTLEGYNDALTDTYVPFYDPATKTADFGNKKDAFFDDYLKLESNVSLIMAEIAKDHGDMSADEIANLSTRLLERLDNILAASSKFIDGQKLFDDPATDDVVEPVNPAFDGEDDAYMTADFGLLKYYLHADWETLQEQQMLENAKLQALRQNIEASAGNIMLYYDMFDATLKAYESKDYENGDFEFTDKEKEGIGEGLATFDSEWNDNEGEVSSKYELALQQQQMAQRHRARYDELQADLDAFYSVGENGEIDPECVVAKAKSDIANYDLKVPQRDENGDIIFGEDDKPVLVDLDVDALFDNIINKQVPLLQARLNALYLKKDERFNQFNQFTTINRNQNESVTYDLYMYGEDRTAITMDWLASYGLLRYYNPFTGQVTIPANDGLRSLNEAVADLVTEYTNKAADREFRKAFRAFDEAFNTVDDTQMRFQDKNEMLYRLFGGDPEEFDETVYETDDEGNVMLDEETNEPIVKTPDESFQKWMTDLFDVVHEQTPETMDAYKEKIQEFIDALAAFGVEAKATRVGDIAGAGADGLQPDGYVNIIDLQRLLNLVNNPSTQPDPDANAKEFGRCDLNSDGFIDIVDLGIMTDIMIGATDYLYDIDPDTGEPVFAARGEKVNETLRADVIATEGTTQRIAISLNNERDYTGFQMDIVLPQGMKLVGQSLSDRADGQQLYANEWNGKTRLVGFTMTKKAFQGNEGAVIYLDVETDETYKGGNVKYENIIFLTTRSKGVHFEMEGQTTGIMSRMADAAKQTIYNLGGRVMDGLKKGVNIISGNGKSEKVIKK